MKRESLFPELEAQLAKYFPSKFTIAGMEPVHGGDIHESYTLSLSSNQRCFLKLNSADNLPLLEQETLALNLIAKQKVIRCPGVFACGIADDKAYLMMEWLPLSSRGNYANLATNLAALHRCTASRFGWGSDNFIGSSPQVNQWHDSWADFWRECRLKPQLAMAQSKGFAAKIKPLQTALLKASDLILQNHSPEASLLHGDLWAGNKGFAEGEPVIFDPASYYGDRETDIAFAHLFGGFEPAYFSSYQKEWPLPVGHEQRRLLYNLYHQLNHLNLFGDSYLSACIFSMQRLISETT